MDEIPQILSISERKLGFLTQLRHICQATHPPDGGQRPDPQAPDTLTRDLCIQMIDEAMEKIKWNHQEFPKILKELRSSLDDVRAPKILSD